MAIFRSLSGRLLVLTILFVMLAEVFIFVPSVARFRAEYLQNRLQMAQIASLALLATPDDMVSPDLEKELLANAEVYAIALRRDEVRELVLMGDLPGPVEQNFDLRDAGALQLIRDAFECAVAPPGRVIRVIGEPTNNAGLAIEVTLNEKRLKHEMIAYGWRIFQLSLMISLFAAVLVFFAVRRFVVRPITGVIGAMTAFSEDPSDPKRVIRPSSRVGEVADAEHALAHMQTDVLNALKQKAHLASLGEAVSKISHDLRNILAASQLMADRLEMSKDPIVSRTGPKLIGSLDRAIRLCERTLAYGKAEEPPPERRRVALRAFVDEVAEAVGLANGGAVVFENAAPSDLYADADPEQLHRALSNLLRNAAEAITASGRGGRIRLSARLLGDGVEIEIADDGPGLPTEAIKHLFKPFKGGARREGSGLGLAIAHELIRAHGGALELASTSTEGSVFRIVLPDAT
jgi:signal transduction histidine kinase